MCDIFLLTSTIGNDQGLADSSITPCLCICFTALSAPSLLDSGSLLGRMSAASPVLKECLTRSVLPRSCESVEKTPANSLRRLRTSSSSDSVNPMTLQSYSCSRGEGNFLTVPVFWEFPRTSRPVSGCGVKTELMFSQQASCVPLFSICCWLYRFITLGESALSGGPQVSLPLQGHQGYRVIQSVPVVPSGSQR